MVYFVSQDGTKSTSSSYEPKYTHMQATACAKNITVNNSSRSSIILIVFGFKCRRSSIYFKIHLILLIFKKNKQNTRWWYVNFSKMDLISYSFNT
jgi:hypothetical protein